MQNKEYLNEETYQKNNVKVKKFGKIFLIIGIATLIIGIVLLISGFIGFGNSAIGGVDSMKDNFSDSIGSINSSMNENDINDTFNSVMDNFSSTTDDMQGVTKNVMGKFGMFVIGAFLLTIGFALTGVGGITMFIAHRREITAYGAQQIMPIAQEGIEKMAPTVGSAAGVIGKELAKGIKEGINETDNKNNE